MKKIVPQNAKLIPDKASQVFDGVIYDVYQWQQELFNGSKTTFEMLKRYDTVRVIAIKDDKVVILEQEQPRHEPFYDIPGGRHDVESESILDAAKRETLEETGMKFTTWKLLEVTQLHPNTMEWFVYIYLAYDFEEQNDSDFDAGEKINVLLKTLKEAKELADSEKTRYLPTHIFDKVKDIKELTSLPAFEGKEINARF